MDPTPRQPDPANPAELPPAPAEAGASPPKVGSSTAEASAAPTELGISDAELTPSPEVIAALAELYGQVPTPPPGFDAAVIAEGQGVVDQARQTKLVAWWRRPRTVAALATAAGLAIVVTASFLALPSSNPLSNPLSGRKPLAAEAGSARKIASAKEARPTQALPDGSTSPAKTERAERADADSLSRPADSVVYSTTGPTPAGPTPSGTPSTRSAPIGQHGMFDGAPSSDIESGKGAPPPSPAPSEQTGRPSGAGTPPADPGSPASSPPPAPPSAPGAAAPAAGSPRGGAPSPGGASPSGARPPGAPNTRPGAGGGAPSSTQNYGGAPAPADAAGTSGAPSPTSAAPAVAPARAKAAPPPDVVDALRLARLLNSGTDNRTLTKDDSALLLILDLDGLTKLEPKHVDELLRRSVQLETHPIRTGSLPLGNPPRGVRIAIAWNTPSRPGGSR